MTGILEELAWFRAQAEQPKPAIDAEAVERAIAADFAEVFGPEGPAQEGAK